MRAFGMLQGRLSMGCDVDGMHCNLVGDISCLLCRGSCFPGILRLGFHISRIWGVIGPFPTMMMVMLVVMVEMIINGVLNGPFHEKQPNPEDNTAQCGPHTSQCR